MCAWLGLGLAEPSSLWDMVTTPCWTLLPLPEMQVLFGSQLVPGWLASSKVDCPFAIVLWDSHPLAVDTPSGASLFLLLGWMLQVLPRCVALGLWYSWGLWMVWLSWFHMPLIWSSHFSSPLFKDIVTLSQLSPHWLPFVDKRFDQH